MRKMVVTAAFLSCLAAAPAEAAPPYPASTVIQGITWDTSTYRSTGVDGDLWPMTWLADDSLRTAFGDATIGCSTKVSYGTVTINGSPPSASLQQIGCGPAGIDKGKIMALGASGTTLFGRFAMQSLSTNIANLEIKRSTDGGKTWQSGWSPQFATSAFVQFGKGNDGAPGGYVYLISVTNGNTLQLTRFLPAKWNVGSSYEYFSGTPAAPAWSTRLSARKPIFYDPNGVQAPTLQYVPGLKRFLLTAAHPKPGQHGVFDSANVYGPWTTVSYVENWLGMGPGGEHWSTYFPLKWQSADGTKLWATFSCHNAKSAGDVACKQYHDRLNIIQATLTLVGSGGNNNGGGSNGGGTTTPPPNNGPVAMTKAEFATRLQSLVGEAGRTGLDNASMIGALQDQAQALQTTR